LWTACREYSLLAQPRYISYRVSD